MSSCCLTIFSWSGVRGFALGSFLFSKHLVKLFRLRERRCEWDRSESRVQYSSKSRARKGRAPAKKDALAWRR